MSDDQPPPEPGHPRDSAEALDSTDVDSLLTGTAILGFLIDGRADLAQELADQVDSDTLVNGQLHINRFLLDGLRDRADLEPADVLCAIRTQAIERAAPEPSEVRPQLDAETPDSGEGPSGNGAAA